MSEFEENEDVEFDNIVVLTDEDGNEENFEFLDAVAFDEKRYAVLLPVDNNPNDEVEIFRIEGEGDDETFVGVDSEEEAQQVFDLFKSQAKERFEFDE